MYIHKDVSQVKKDISRCIGSRVTLESNKGRQKATVSNGVIEGVYPSVFTILVGEGTKPRRTVSYSYTDVLTRAVEITLCE